MPKRLPVSAIRRNPWLEHVDETIKKNPNMMYKDILKKASITYKIKSVPKKRGRKPKKE